MGQILTIDPAAYTLTSVRIPIHEKMVASFHIGWPLGVESTGVRQLSERVMKECHSRKQEFKNRLVEYVQASMKKVPRYTRGRGIGGHHLVRPQGNGLKFRFAMRQHWKCFVNRRQSPRR